MPDLMPHFYTHKSVRYKSNNYGGSPTLYMKPAGRFHFYGCLITNAPIADNF